MNRLSKITLAAALAATATLAAAQTSDKARAFADEFAILQSYSSDGPTYHPAPKTFSSTSQDPATKLTESEMQARSDESAIYQPDHGAVQATNGPTFAKTNPHGLPFSYYEAESSSSNEWNLPASAGALADATASGPAEAIASR